ncbi:adenylate/guanylate cyclase domain-containing protein [Denitrobaculum tricleocarpae]|uniref:Adenylate/guanylate cyclase domain-containing protein n=1 Tax=Denitrobaculum tricleocarpae TaxID=2591009 RepID=A0A545TL65_9PROT|nr:adenylate/guanylate cyclase domain-containing protein [Denitrobaculum tricleocarpae]TQV77947.1 adenylate/guanylate cyclase domain-containing protein [Denitrobaculum tricleocarpae]
MDDRVSRLARAEAQGLRIAIVCRTLAVLALAVMIVISYQSADRLPRSAGAIALASFVLIGMIYYPLIGSRWDRPWAKYLLFALDILLLCACFVIIPISPSDDVPQILAFRAYGIYYLLPFIGLACLSLSWGLVAWTGAITAIGWWSAFGYVVSGMETTLSWADLPTKATVQDYEEVFLSTNFIGTGNRLEETGFVLILALILAVAVYRARSIFFAQLRAEDEREAEREARERVSQTLGQYVPETIAARLVEDSASMEPQVRRGAVLVADIEAFSSFAAGRDPHDVIETLNAFLAECTDQISRRDGVVISYLGDGFLVTFNTPLAVANPATAALQAAQDLIALTDGKSFKGHRIKLRIGIASGDIAAGIVGSEKRQAFTVYGETVNRAARLEQFNKKTGTTILMDSATREQATDFCATRCLGDHELRGLSQAVEVWTPAAAAAN